MRKNKRVELIIVIESLSGPHFYARTDIYTDFLALILFVVIADTNKSKKNRNRQLFHEIHTSLIL